MGYLLIDHSAGTGPDGLTGKKVEFDTVSCCHCQALIRVVIKGVEKAYECPYRCDRCRAPICKFCATTLGGACSPIMAKVEECLKTGIWPTRHAYKYRILPQIGRAHV